MIVNKPGTYRLLKDLEITGPTGVGMMPKGVCLTVDKVDIEGERLTGPCFPGWHPWELPVELAEFEPTRRMTIAEIDPGNKTVTGQTLPVELVEEKPATDKPKIVCLCGSTRFYNAFQLANYNETMEGKIVLSVGFFMHSPQTIHGQELGCTEDQKIMLDELHKRKIDLADEVLILNVGGYIGESTRSELDYAIKSLKQISYLEPV